MWNLKRLYRVLCDTYWDSHLIVIETVISFSRVAYRSCGFCYALEVHTSNSLQSETTRGSCIWCTYIEIQGHWCRQWWEGGHWMFHAEHWLSGWGSEDARHRTVLVRHRMDSGPRSKADDSNYGARDTKDARPSIVTKELRTLGVRLKATIKSWGNYPWGQEH